MRSLPELPALFKGIDVEMSQPADPRATPARGLIRVHKLIRAEQRLAEACERLRLRVRLVGLLGCK